MERIFTIRHTIGFSESDLNSSWKPSGVLQVAQDISGRHADLLGCGFGTISQNGAIWLLMRQRFRLSRYPKEGEEIEVTTWPGPPRLTLFPRYLVFKDGAGETFGAASALWTLVDRDSRRLLTAAHAGVVMPDNRDLAPPLPLPQKIAFPRQEGEPVIRRVNYSDADLHYHMNNARYMEWVCDLLDPMRFKREYLCDFSLNYVHEARLGTAVALRYAEEGDTFFVSGRDAGTDQEVFSCTGIWAKRE